MNNLAKKNIRVRKMRSLKSDGTRTKQAKQNTLARKRIRKAGGIGYVA